MCEPGSIPIKVRSCFPIGLGFSYQVQTYSNLGIPINGPISINTSINNSICIPFFAGPIYVGIQAVNLQNGSVTQTSNLALVSAGSEIVFTIQNDSLRILVNGECCPELNTFPCNNQFRTVQSNCNIPQCPQRVPLCPQRLPLCPQRIPVCRHKKVECSCKKVECSCKKVECSCKKVECSCKKSHYSKTKKSHHKCQKHSKYQHF